MRLKKSGILENVDVLGVQTANSKISHPFPFFLSNDINCQFASYHSFHRISKSQKYLRCFLSIFSLIKLIL